jgi:hypothetical protein
MRSLFQSLQDYDLGLLRAIAELWALDPPTGDAPEAARRLTERLQEPTQLAETLDSLPASASQALGELASGGPQPWADFRQRHGEIREMGPGRRDRLRPWRQPVSDSERLYYRGLIARAFADSPVGPREFVYIPTELSTAIQPQAISDSALGRPAEPPGAIARARSSLVDDSATLLAALRRWPTTPTGEIRQRLLALHPFLTQPAAGALCLHLLTELNLLDPDRARPEPERVGSFLDLNRADTLAALIRAWLDSGTWNDLAQLEHLRAGPTGWPNEPLPTRQAALQLIRGIPVGRWWDLPDFVDAVRQRHPGFMRPGADFDSWYLRDRRTGAFLQGTEAWPAVDGALLRWLLMGPLHWLGAVDLGHKDGEPPDRFRLTAWSSVVFGGPIPGLDEPTANGRLQADGSIALPRAASRSLRYQIARLSAWLGYADDTYHYRLRPTALLAAAEQGLRHDHIVKLLEEVGPAPLPARLQQALARVLANGVEASIDALLVLQVSQPELLDQLLANRRLRGLVQERLGPTAALIRRKDLAALSAAAAKDGLLIEASDQAESS